MNFQIQLTFPEFKLQRPNECDANFIDIFRESTDMFSRERNFCSSVADLTVIRDNIAHLRFYAEPKASNSTFEAVMTAFRDKDGECEFFFKHTIIDTYIFGYMHFRNVTHTHTIMNLSVNILFLYRLIQCILN